MSTNSSNSTGQVTLVGAGPGDVGLITVAGLACLQAADVVVHDRLINRDLLAHAPSHALIVDVGKRADYHPWPQARINELMLEHARAGRSVVRLKGGDPFLFGRGAEEAIFLHQHGIPCRVIHGVSAGISVPGSAGIPVTLRDLAGSVTFVTGHQPPDKADNAASYQSLADLANQGGTVCFFMGMTKIDRITQALIGCGCPPTLPVAIVTQGTLPDQRCVRGSLSNIAALAHEAQLTPPAVIVVGKVAGLNEPGLEQFTRRPLFGQRIAVTRQAEQLDDMRQRLEALGASVIAAPTIAVEPVADTAACDRAIDQLGDCDWAVLTSVNGVNALAKRLAARQLDARVFAHVRLAAVGTATAGALQAQLGLRADLVPEKFVAESLAQAMAADRSLAGRRIVMFRGDLARPALTQLLTAAGAQVDDVVVYRNTPAASLPANFLDPLRRGEVDWITFTSSSTAKNLFDLLGDDAGWLKKVKLASIGPITSTTLRELGLSVDAQASEHTVDGLIASIVEAIHGDDMAEAR